MSVNNLINESRETHNGQQAEARKLTTMSIKEWQTIMRDYDKLAKSWLKK